MKADKLLIPPMNAKGIQEAIDSSKQYLANAVSGHKSDTLLPPVSVLLYDATSAACNLQDDIAALQAENARLMARINAMTEMHKHTEGVYDMQYRLERENSMMLFHALSKVAPDTLKGLKLNQSNTELDKVYLEYSRRLEQLSMALVNVRDAETLEECREVARNALEGGE